MAEKKTSTDIVSATRQGGVVRDMMNKVKLIFRLMGDSRVNALAKIIPVGALAYLIFPFDGDITLPIIGMVDDAAILWLGTYVFTELCPPAVVAEHLKALEGEAAAAVSSQDEIVDAESTDVSDEEPPSK